MKTRIVWTKFWTDDFVAGLDGLTKLLFLYYFTNEHIGLTGIYELSDRIVKFETGFSDDQLKACKKSLTEHNKVFFFEGWVYVVNSQRLGGYHGEKLQPAVLKEINNIPSKVYQYFTDTLSIDYRYTIDTPKNHKSETINHKTKIINNKSEIIKQKEELIDNMDIGDFPI